METEKPVSKHDYLNHNDVNELATILWHNL